MADLKGSAASAAEHQHGVQVKETGTADKTVVQRLDELEARVAQIEARVAKIEQRFARQDGRAK